MMGLQLGLGWSGVAGATPSLPGNTAAVVRQAAAAVGRAFVEGGLNHQTVRLPLSEAMYSDSEEGFVADRAIGWQGGPRETYRYLQPVARQLMQAMDAGGGDTGGVPPRLKEQTLLDFDGSALLTAESPFGALHDVQALLQPNADGYYLKLIRGVEAQFSDLPGKPPRLFVLVNPAWRDRSSWGFFDGKAAQQLVLDRYETTFALDQFIVRGQKVSLLRVWPEDWCVYVTSLDGTEARDDARLDGAGQARLLGTFAERPAYKDVDELCRNAINALKS